MMPFIPRRSLRITSRRVLAFFAFLSMLGGGYLYVSGAPETVESPLGLTLLDSSFVDVWTGPTEQQLAKVPPTQQALIKYGRELIAHTADYLGPKGSVRTISNGMNCQNCHLQAGTQPWGNNYFAVESVRSIPSSGRAQER